MLQKSENILYIETNTGISGDMVVAALLDLGRRMAENDSLKKQGVCLDEPDLMEKELCRVVENLPIDGYEISISRKKRAGIDVCDFDVILDKEHENHDHDMEYLYGHEHAETHYSQNHDQRNTHGDTHTEDHMHTHDSAHHTDHVETHSEAYTHSHEHTHTHHHSHRTLKDVEEILDKADMTSGAHELALKIFRILARAEGKAHGVSVDEVHFHEVGATDSIVDIVAASICFDLLAPDRVIVSPLTEGSGTVRTQHGVLPVPVPAVAAIAEDEGLPLRMSNLHGEYVTPTGAAIAAAVRDGAVLPDSYIIEATGIGGGKRDYDPPSMVRAMWLHSDDSTADHICRLETDIDDCTGEELGRVMELCYRAGAREVHFSPIFMKKNRPAYELVVISSAEDVKKLEEIIFKETTTIGIRRQWMERTVLPREDVKAQTEYGEIDVKRVTLPDGTVRDYPEYESLKEISERTGEPITVIKKDPSLRSG